LTTLLGVGQDLVSLGDTLEESIIVCQTRSAGLLVGMMLEYLFAVGDLNLVLSSLVSQTGETKNSVVILRLKSGKGPHRSQYESSEGLSLP
jgi:hypothetical protein